MTKKVSHFRLFALVAALFCFLGASAHDFEYEGYYYSILSDSTVSITYQTGSTNNYSGDVTIPEIVYYNGNYYTVVRVSANAFSQCTSLTSVTIPKSVTCLGTSAFEGCSSLHTVEMGKNCGFYNLEDYSLSVNVFKDCPNLTLITCWEFYPKMFLEVEDYLNFDQSVLANATLYVPRGAVSNYQAVEGWRLFSHIQEAEADYNYDFYAYGIFYKYMTNSTVMVTYRDEDFNSYSGTVTVPQALSYNGTGYSVTTIDEFAFRECSGLMGVVLPSGLDSIGRYAFMNCARLTEIEIPNTVSKMGNAVFQGCSNVKSIMFPAMLTEINASMCRNCYGLETLIIPSGVTNIYASAFSDCNALKTVICFGAVAPTIYNQLVFPSAVYGNATLYVLDNAAGYSSPYGYWKNFTTQKPYSELLDQALNVDGGTIHFTSTGNYPWLVKKEYATDYAQSGNKWLPGSASELTAVVTVPAGTILNFDFKAWGEGAGWTAIWDMCAFYVNGELILSYGPYQNVNWETCSVTLPGGTNTLTWRYTKDDYDNSPGDYFAINEVSLIVPPVTRGDADGDGGVSIADVTALIGYLLTGNASGVNLANADCDLDSFVGIDDVTTLVRFLLKGTW